MPIMDGHKLKARPWFCQPKPCRNNEPKERFILEMYSRRDVMALFKTDSPCLLIRRRLLKLARCLAGCLLLATFMAGLATPLAAYEKTIDRLRAELAAARRQLHNDQLAIERIAADLERLRQSGEASAQIVEDYTQYLASYRALVDEKAQAVQAMQAALSRAATASPQTDANLEPSLETLPQLTVTDDVIVLDRELQLSLAAFDEQLLEEWQIIQAQSTSEKQSWAQEAAAAAGRLKDQGIDLGGEQAPQRGEGEGEGRKAETKSKERETESETASTDSAGTGSKTGGQPDTGSGQEVEVAKNGSYQGGEGKPRRQTTPVTKEDDDIVARQLREAAENETDPELKAKLWKEYEDYKNATR
jgi:hypothetical protein